MWPLKITRMEKETGLPLAIPGVLTPSVKWVTRPQRLCPYGMAPQCLNIDPTQYFDHALFTALETPRLQRTTTSTNLAKGRNLEYAHWFSKKQANRTPWHTPLFQWSILLLFFTSLMPPYSNQAPFKIISGIVWFLKKYLYSISEFP